MSRDFSAELPQPSWEYATWDGSRKAMIERARRLSLRQRLDEMQSLIELHEKFSRMREKRRLSK